MSVAAVLVVVAAGCDGFLVEGRPDVAERKGATQLLLADESGLMMRLYGDEGVPDAEIVLRSNRLGDEHALTSGEAGYVDLAGLASGTYHLSAVRSLTDAEAETATGVATGRLRLRNAGAGTIVLRADRAEVITVPMQLTSDGAPVVISEIYGAGPPGAGLYYHDKYVELHNQTDSTVYLDGLVVAVVYASSYTGENYIDDPDYVHSKSVWRIPGEGTDHPLEAGGFAVLAADAIDHRINAPESVDLTGARFEFYKDDAPDIDNAAAPNMVRLYQPYGNDWLIGGERDALVLARTVVDSLQISGDRLLIPLEDVIDGAEYLGDPARLDEKKLSTRIDAGATGGVSFYTGRSVERLAVESGGLLVLKDDDNSALDFAITDAPTPGYHYSTP